MSPQYDAIVAGGGPAGLVSVLQLERIGWRALVIEADQLPRDRACGEGIMPTGIAELRTLGLELTGGMPLHGIAYRTGSGATARARFAEGPGRGILRTQLSAALFEKVRSRPRIEVLPGTRVIEIFCDDTGSRVLLDRGEQISSRLIVGADGLSSFTRRSSGLALPGRRFRRFGMRQHFLATPWDDCVQVYLREDVEAYVTPVDRDRIGVAFLWHADRLRPEPAGRRGFDSLLALFPLLKQELKSARSLDDTLAIGPLEQRTRSPVALRLALVGDASGYLDAITGEGLSLAFEQARVLAECLGDIDREVSRELEGALRLYRRRHRSLTRNYYRMTGALLRITRRPALYERLVRALQAAPDLFARLLSINMGTAAFSSIPPGAALRFVAAFLGLR